LRGASPFGGKGCSGGVVAVNEESAGGGNPFALEFGWLEREAFIVAAKDGAFTVGVNEDKGLMAGAIRSGKEMRFDAGAGKFGTVKLRGVVVTEFADVTGAKSPELASDHGAGDLSARKNAGGFEFDFGTARGYSWSGMRVSVALRPTPTTSTCGVALTGSESCAKGGGRRRREELER